MKEIADTVWNASASAVTSGVTTFIRQVTLGFFIGALILIGLMYVFYKRFMKI